MTTDLILDGRPEVVARRIRHPRRWVLGLVVVAAALFLVDRWLQQREFEQLAHRVAAVQAEINYADAHVSGAIRYGSPQLFMASSPPELRAYLQGLVNDASVQGATDVGTAEAAVKGVPILPWHRSLIDARDASGSYAELWRTFLASSLSGRVETSNWTAQLTAGRRSANARLQDAIPPGDRGNDRALVDGIFNPPS